MTFFLSRVRVTSHEQFWHNITVKIYLCKKTFWWERCFSVKTLLLHFKIFSNQRYQWRVSVQITHLYNRNVKECYLQFTHNILILGVEWREPSNVIFSEKVASKEPNLHFNVFQFCQRLLLNNTEFGGKKYSRWIFFPITAFWFLEKLDYLFYGDYLKKYLITAG